MAPPKKPLDLVMIEKLATIHCTMNEIASAMDCSVDTLERRCADIIKKGKDKGKASLRRLQWEGAQKGNPTMLIWLGKQLLGQTDKVEQNVTAYVGSSDKVKELTADIRKLHSLE